MYNKAPPTKELLLEDQVITQVTVARIKEKMLATKLCNLQIVNNRLEPLGLLFDNKYKPKTTTTPIAKPNPIPKPADPTPVAGKKVPLA